MKETKFINFIWFKWSYLIAWLINLILLNSFEISLTSNDLDKYFINCHNNLSLNSIRRMISIGDNLYFYSDKEIIQIEIPIKFADGYKIKYPQIMFYKSESLKKDFSILGYDLVFQSGRYNLFEIQRSHKDLMNQCTSSNCLNEKDLIFNNCSVTFVLNQIVHIGVCNQTSFDVANFKSIKFFLSFFGYDDSNKEVNQKIFYDIDDQIKFSSLSFHLETRQFTIIELKDNGHLIFHQLPFEIFRKKGLKLDFGYADLQFNELFHCNDQLNPNQLKGIIYNLKSDYYYFIVNRWYYRLNGDKLMRNNFKINQIQNKIAIDFKYENSIEKKSILFIESNMRWIVEINNQIYLMLDIIENHFDQTFLISFDDDYISFKKIDSQLFKKNIYFFNTCSTGSKFQINETIYCFQERRYYLTAGLVSNHPFYELTKSNETNSGGYLIKNLFNNSQSKFDDDDELKFIFNYKTDKLILMTLKFYFLIDIQLISTNSETGEIFMKQEESDKRIIKQRNCLFIECNDDQTEEIPKSVFILFIFSLICLFLLSSFVFIWICYLPFKSSTKIENDKIDTKLADNSYSYVKKKLNSYDCSLDKKTTELNKQSRSNKSSELSKSSKSSKSSKKTKNSKIKEISTVNLG